MTSLPTARTGLCSFLGACLLAGLAGCAGTPTVESSARIEVEEAVGFTITEEARVGNDARASYDEAMALLDAGRVDEGLVRLQEAAAQAPGLSAPHIGLGIAHHRAGDLAAAEASLETALGLNPEHPIALNELGIIYRKTGRFAEARSAYEAALDVYPGYHYARRNLAILCDLYLADTACALENYHAYLATVPGDDEVSMWIADLELRAGLQEAP